MRKCPTSFFSIFRFFHIRLKIRKLQQHSNC
nr:MAG TPA: hypothetical protein [Caudoviricetes sp.]